MLKGREQLEGYLDNKLANIGLSKQSVKETVTAISERHNISQVRLMNILSHRASLAEATEFELFCFLQYVKESRIAEFFTQSEIDNWTEYKIEQETDDIFPIIINCYPVTDDQYIGGTDTNFFMKLREHQLINYNTSAQRTMQKMVRGDFEYYKISLNKAAVNQIKRSFEDRTFISNTITLNMPIKETSKWHYDDKNKQLIIDEIEAFDISDGYHRYVGMCAVKDAYPDWNYPMEIRVVSFDNDRVRNFIFQEDQKTKMKKVDSDSMNMNSNANIVVDRINQDARFDLKGEIRRNGGRISFGELASLIDYFYFKGQKFDKPEGLVRANVQKRFVEQFNELVESDESLFTRQFSFKDLCVIMYGFANGIETQQIVNVLTKADELPNTKFANKTPRKTLFTDVEALYK